MSRFAIFVHNPDADMGDSVVVGPFYDSRLADQRAAQIMRRDEQLEAFVVPVMPSRTSARAIVDVIVGDAGHNAGVTS